MQQAMEKHDLIRTQLLYQLSSDALLAAEQEDWDKTLQLQQQLHDLYQRSPQLDINLIPQSLKNDWLDLLAKLNQNLILLDAVFVERKAFLAGFLHGASNLNKVNKAYFGE
ncbi:hypothetical protein [uncultured Deefgea sp.]|uniref:hypothetical protein n=1 Tax=uncultured Deefgea sp. TaxID=1304914 RepID=UPI00260DF974|nr:hypothetical protein [uncultured Deefgea sp.]